MNETVANGFMWWGIIVSAFWFLWITCKGITVNNIERNAHDDWREFNKRINKLEEKAGIKNE